MDRLSVQKAEVTSRSATGFVVRVEVWHCAIVSVLVALAAMTGWLEPLALLGGGIFMAANFFLLSMGVRLIVSPNVSTRRRRVGAALLVLKLLLFLGLISTVFFQLRLDVVSFVVGISVLLIASVIAGLSPVEYKPLPG